MNTRNLYARNRDLEEEISFRNPLFLHFYFVTETIRYYFQSLPTNRKLRIYDFGFGQKPYEIFIKNHDYIGIDIDKKNSKADIYADITCVPLDDNTADIVVSFFVLEHVENPQKVIDEMYRVLKPNGRLFMLAPLYWEEHEQPYDFFRFTRYGIKKLMENAGFKDIMITEVNTHYSILGMHLAKLFNRRFLRIFIPIINYIFWKMEIRTQLKARKNNILLSDVISFSVQGVK